MATRSKKVKVNVGADKASIQSRVDRGKAVAAAAPASPIYKNEPGVKAACDAYVERGAQLAAADSALQITELAAAKARSARDAAQEDHDSAYDLYVANVERHAGTREEVQGLGLTILARSSYALVAPLGIRARFDAQANILHVSVTQAPGLRSCVVEMSSDDAEPRSWTRLPGVGSRQEVANPTPGTVWLRAASVSATEQSAFSPPIAVTVK